MAGADEEGYRREPYRAERGYVPDDRGFGPRVSDYGPFDHGWASAGRDGPFAGRGPKGYHRPDSRIHEDVSDRPMASPDVDATDVEVTVGDGKVTLSGSVRTRCEKREPEYVAERVAGVRDVHNKLRVNHAPAATNVEP